MTKNIIQVQLEKIRKKRELLNKKEKLLLVKVNEKVLEKIVQLAQNSGLSGSVVAQAINAGKPSKSRTKKGKNVLTGVKIPPKYRNPANPKEVWTGRGVSPRWAQDLKDRGQLETALIAVDAVEKSGSTDFTSAPLVSSQPSMPFTSSQQE